VAYGQRDHRAVGASGCGKTSFHGHVCTSFSRLSVQQPVPVSHHTLIALADDLGRWNGTGMSTLKTVFAPIGGGAVRFNGNERYTLSIIHGMRDTVLTGIQDVVVKFEQAEN
jgi:gliding motility-associated lipoprotein GldH